MTAQAAPGAAPASELGTSGAVIDVRDVHKTFGEVQAVDGVTFSVARGEIFASSGRTGRARPRPSRCWGA